MPETLRVPLVMALLLVGAALGIGVAFQGPSPASADPAETAAPVEASAPPLPAPAPTNRRVEGQPVTKPDCGRACDASRLEAAIAAMTLRRTFALGAARADLDGRVVHVGELIESGGVTLELVAITPETATLSALVWIDHEHSDCRETTVTLARARPP